MTNPPPNYPTPVDLKGCRRGAEWAAVVSAAQDIGLFDALADGPSATSALAAQLDLRARALEIVIGVLDALGLVRRHGRQVEMTAEGRARFLDPDSGVYEAVASRRRERHRTRAARVFHGRHGQQTRGAGCARRGCLSGALPLGSDSPGPRGRPRPPQPGPRPTRAGRDAVRSPGDDRPCGRGVRTARPSPDRAARRRLSQLPALRPLRHRAARQHHPYSRRRYEPATRSAAGLDPTSGWPHRHSGLRPRDQPLRTLVRRDHAAQHGSGDTYPLEAYHDWLYGAGYGEVTVENLDPDRQLITALRTA